jgi:hypothetical protein
LQIGYCKAKQAFFSFRLADLPGEDIAFLMRRYFPGQVFRLKPVRKEEYYIQRKEILRLFGYRCWSREFLPRLEPLCASRTGKASAAPRYGSSVIYRQRISLFNCEIVCRVLRRRRQDEGVRGSLLDCGQ